MIDTIKRLHAHTQWADEKLIVALKAHPEAAEAWREYNHILAAEELWIDRLETGQSGSEVWPSHAPADADALRAKLASRYERFIDSLTEATADKPIAYSNTKGRQFTTPASDILIHVALHGHYHRGKVNLLLRQGGLEPSPADFIAFARGVPAATSK